MNIFRILGDSAHLFAIFLLVVNIIVKRTCTSVSGKSQLILAIVFMARYSDLFTSFISVYNTSMKIIFISTAIVTNYLIHYKYKSKYENNHDNLSLAILIPPALLAIMVNMSSTDILKTVDVIEVFWTYSIFLEAVAILPQLYLVLKKGEAEMIVAYYVAALSFYRGFYILNWWYRYSTSGNFDWISIGGGTVQIVIYSMFFLLPVEYKSNDAKKCARDVTTISGEISKEDVPFSIYENIIITPGTLLTAEEKCMA